MSRSTRRQVAVVLAAVLAAFGLVLASTGPASALTTSKVTAKPAATSVWYSFSDSVSGTVSPGVSGRYVTLQKLSAGKWVDAYSVKTGSGGAYKLPISTNRAGTVTYRVKAVGTSRYATAYSTSFKVSTRSWVVKTVTGSSCKKLAKGHWRLNVYTTFTNGRTMMFDGMEVWGSSIYIGQMSWGGQTIDFNWTYTGRCA